MGELVSTWMKRGILQLDDASIIRNRGCKLFANRFHCLVGIEKRKGCLEYFLLFKDYGHNCLDSLLVFDCFFKALYPSSNGRIARLWDHGNVLEWGILCVGYTREGGWWVSQICGIGNSCASNECEWHSQAVRLLKCFIFFKSQSKNYPLLKLRPGN
jgi:hypothetical protein